VLAISVDAPDKSRELANKLNLPFQVLSDQQHTVIDSYGVYDSAGKIAVPSSFVIDKNQTVRWSYIGKDNTDRPADDDILAAVNAQ
jgi:peroxiredoxin